MHYPLVGDARSLLWLANQNSHHAARLERRACRSCTSQTSASSISIRRATTIRSRCGRRRSRCATCSRSSGCRRFVKTSGSKGFHILVPLDGETDFESVWRFAHGAARSWSSGTPRC